MNDLAPESTLTIDAPASEQPKGKRRRGQGPRGARNPEGGGESRQQRPRGERPPLAGWGDGIERCICVAASVCVPRAFPVQHRTGIATIAPAIVDRSPTRILLCDGQHDGPHIWPDNEVSAG